MLISNNEFLCSGFPLAVDHVWFPWVPNYADTWLDGVYYTLAFRTLAQSLRSG
jgi:hypothetical protein